MISTRDGLERKFRGQCWGSSPTSWCPMVPPCYNLLCHPPIHSEKITRNTCQWLWPIFHLKIWRPPEKTRAASSAHRRLLRPLSAARILILRASVCIWHGCDGNNDGHIMINQLRPAGNLPSEHENCTQAAWRKVQTLLVGKEPWVSWAENVYEAGKKKSFTISRLKTQA